MRPARAALLFLGATLFAGVTSAQPAADPGEQAAALFREGREALEKGEHVLACKRFTESLALSKRASTLLNLAQCEEGQRHLVAAIRRWNEGIALLDAADDRIAPSKERAAALERRLPRVTVKIAAGAPAGTVITMDGTALDGASLGAPLPVDPGDHVLVVTAPGQLDQRSTISLAENERREVTLAPGLVPTAAATTTAAATASGTDRPPSTLRTIGFVTAAVGLAGLVAAGVTGGILAGNDGTIKTNCPDKRCNELGASTLEASRSLLVVNAIAFGAGAAFAGLGTVLILVGGSSSPPTRDVRQSLPHDVRQSLPRAAAGAPNSATLLFTGAF